MQDLSTAVTSQTVNTRRWRTGQRARRGGHEAEAPAAAAGLRRRRSLDRRADGGRAPPVTADADRSAARAAARAFRGINGLRPAGAGPLHLFHAAPAAALAGGARGAARRPTDAGQAPARWPGVLRGTHSHERLPRKTGQGLEGPSVDALERRPGEPGARICEVTDGCHEGPSRCWRACDRAAVRVGDVVCVVPDRPNHTWSPS